MWFNINLCFLKLTQIKLSKYFTIINHLNNSCYYLAPTVNPGSTFYWADKAKLLSQPLNIVIRRGVCAANWMWLKQPFSFEAQNVKWCLHPTHRDIQESASCMYRNCPCYFFWPITVGKDQLPGKSNHAFKNLGNASKPVKPKPEAILSLTSSSYRCPSMSTSVVISRRDLDHGCHMLQKRAFQIAVSFYHDIPLKLRPTHIQMVRIQMRILIYTKENLVAQYDKNQMWSFFSYPHN